MYMMNEPAAELPSRQPWNKGKFTGPKSPLQARYVWAIRTRLQLADRKRDLALFNLALQRQQLPHQPFQAGPRQRRDAGPS